MNHVVGEVELHFVKREVREGDFLRVDWVPIAVIAEHSRGTVGVNFQVPDLELFAGNAGIMLLGDCDDVEQPEAPPWSARNFAPSVKRTARLMPWRYQFSEPVNWRS